MPIVDAPLIIRLYQAIGLSFPPGARHMPSLDATVPLPNCLLCGRRASPPSTMGWLGADGDQRAFSVCSNCGWDCDDAELEQKIHAKFSDSRRETVAATTTETQTPLPAPLPAEAAPRVGIGSPLTAAARPVPASEAAKAWVQAAVREWTQQPPAA